MPTGIMLAIASVFFGGLLGAWLGKYLPERTRESLSNVFGVMLFAIGITLVVKLHSLAVVCLSAILGAIIGEGLRLEDKIGWLSQKLVFLFERGTQKTGERAEDFIRRYVVLVVLFCTGSTGLLGVMTEGMTGDPSVLYVKALMDFFTSAVFATSLGASVSLISLLQIPLFFGLFFLARLVMPLASPEMVADFLGYGGLISIANGFRLLEIKHIRVPNFLPSFILVMPISWFFTNILGL